MRKLHVSVSSEFREFLAAFYTEALAGNMIAWIKNKERIDKEALIQDVRYMFF